MSELTVERCDCQSDLRRRQRIDAAKIPKRYESCRLATFRAETTTLKNAKKRVEDFILEWPTPSQGKGLLLVGPPGCGKTHLAVSVLLGIINSGKTGRVLFSNFSELIQDIQTSFEFDHVPTKAELLGPLIDAELLVIDELGSVKLTPWIQDILYYVINSRYSDAKTTIFTTNYFDNPADGSPPLEDRIGKQLRSRLWEMTLKLDFSGAEDYRKKRAIL